MKQKLIILTIFILAGCSDKKASDKSVAKSENHKDFQFPTEARFKNPDNLFGDTLIAKVDKIDFLITPRGKMFWGHNPADTMQLFTDMFIEKALLHLQNDTLLIFYTETDNDVATSRMEKINLTSRQTILKAEINGFNLGLPYIVDNYAYVTTIGVVGKLNLNNGKYIYQYSDLYDNKKYSFNSFDTIIFKDSLTFFLSENRNGKRIDSLIVNEKTSERTIKK